MIPIVCLHSKTKIKEYEVILFSSLLHPMQKWQVEYMSSNVIVAPQDQEELEWPKDPQSMLFSMN